jgi:hypothetical protein
LVFKRKSKIISWKLSLIDGNIEFLPSGRISTSFKVLYHLNIVNIFMKAYVLEFSRLCF